jgi:prephenate dehydrogenase
VKVAVLGVGLIGGSIGLAARRRSGAQVVGYDPDGRALSRAVELGAIDEPASELADAVCDADFVFVAAPVGAGADTARLALAAAGPDCVVSDVGSTKRQIVGAISDPRFVGGHPLAGSETAGVENAHEDLFDGAVWCLTPAAGAVAAGAEGIAGASTPVGEAPSPPAGSAGAALERLRSFVERLGARPVTLDAGDHDRLMASASHLSHVLANVLVAQARRAAQAVADGGAREVEGALSASPSFRDATRVAGANTAIWTDIYVSNSDLLAEALDGTIEELSAVRDALDAEDSSALAAWNERARSEREKLRRADPARGS